MDFTLSTEIEEYRQQIRMFVNEHLIPLENDPLAYDKHENIDEDVLANMREKARVEGLWCFQMPKELGGRGVGVVGMAALYEEMNRSIFGASRFQQFST